MPIHITIPVCHRQHSDDARRAAAILAKIAADVRRVKAGSEVELDIKGFLYPVAVAFLAAVRQQLVDQGCRVQLTGFTDYLARIHFPGVAPEAVTGRALQLVIHRSMREHDFGRYVRDEWLGHIMNNVSPRAGEYLVMALGEVYENAFIHSNSPVGVALFGQFYPATHQYHLALVDLGHGIPGSVADFLGHDETSIDAGGAIKWAFERLHSTLPNARGSGLPILRTFVTRNEGEVEVFSGAGYALLGSVTDFRKLPVHLRATCFNVILRNVNYITGPEESLF